MQYLIKEGTIVNENNIFTADILIKNGRIDKIDNDIQTKNSNIIIDARGLFIFPGMIDDQVHFREPGLNYKADIESESKAAIRGGITSYMEMPNCNPATTTISRLKDKKILASKKSHANYAFYLGTTNDNVSELSLLSPNDACGIKIFMGSSTGNLLVSDPDVLEQFFKNSPVLIATHCEYDPIIRQNESFYRKKYGDDIPISYHPFIRSREACLKSSSLAVSLAKKYNSKLHVLHLTTQDELNLFSPNKAVPLKNKLITSEVCAHHLFFSANDYKNKGSLIKCNPAIKDETDKQALLDGLNSNIIDVVATDHAPHTWFEKNQTYFNAPAGLPLVEHAVLSILEHFHKGLIKLEKIVHKISHAPAIIYKVKERGFIREGYWADLVLINLDAENRVSHQNSHYKCGWTPFHGHKFSSKIEKTFINGILKFDGDKIISDNLGKELQFSHF